MSKVPKNPRPEVVAPWFKYGRQFSKKHTPKIQSVSAFEDEWLAWWSATQPAWRESSNWPFKRGDAVGCDWGDLPEGGKDGLFLIVISLGWWLLARNPSEDSEVDEAIKDVTWVIDNLVSLLSADATNSDVTDDTPVLSSPLPRGKRPAPLMGNSRSKRKKVART